MKNITILMISLLSFSDGLAQNYSLEIRKSGGSCVCYLLQDKKVIDWIYRTGCRTVLLDYKITSRDTVTLIEKTCSINYNKYFKKDGVWVHDRIVSHQVGTNFECYGYLPPRLRPLLYENEEYKILDKDKVLIKFSDGEKILNCKDEFTKVPEKDKKKIWEELVKILDKKSKKLKR